MITFRYILFAVISIIANFAVQHIVCLICDVNNNLTFYLAMGGGTIAGLIVKYILDKQYIFYYSTISKTEDLRKFAVYSLMGVVTTIVFWGTETLFHYFSDVKEGKYIGGTVGLALGYFIKFHLDKKFVFEDQISEIVS